MDLESTIIQINDLVWKHTKHVEQNKKRFGQESLVLIEEVGKLAVQCEKTENFITDIESRLEQVASTPTKSEILLYQMLLTAQTNLESTQNALEDARSRLEKLNADHEAMTELHDHYSATIQRYCAENASLVAQWQELLGCRFELQNGRIQVQFDDFIGELYKDDYGYKLKYGETSLEYDFDGSLPRLLLKLRALSKTT